MTQCDVQAPTLGKQPHDVLEGLGRVPNTRLPPGTFPATASPAH